MNLPKKIIPLKGVLELSTPSERKSENKIKLESFYSEIP